MDSLAFDRLTRLVALVRSRRALAGAVAGAIVGLRSLAPVAAAPCPKGKKRCKGKCIPKKACCTTANCRPAATSRICRRRRCVCHPSTKPCEGRCIHPDAACPPAPNAECTVVGTVQNIFPGDLRAAQTFTEPNGGKLTMVELYFARELPDTTGAFLVQINTVDQATGIPLHNTIASAIKPAADISRNLDLVYFQFNDPPTLLPGQRYAILLSWPGEGRAFRFEVVQPGASCPDGALFVSYHGSGTFEHRPQSEDMYYRTYVSQ